MPRDGSGASDNAIEAGSTLAHGADGSEPKTDIVDRADKTAPLPEPEQGEGLRNADGTPMTSGGSGLANPGSGAQGSGKGPAEGSS